MLSCPLPKRTNTNDSLLEICAAEKIRTPGEIQSDGVLFVCDEFGLIRRVSENLQQFVELSPDEILGRPIAEFLPVSQWATPTSEPTILGTLPSHEREGRWLIRSHRRQNQTIWELIPDAELIRPIDLTSIAVLMSEHRPLVDFLNDVAHVLRQGTGYDRVMIYRFDPDWNGQVVAESATEAIEPYLGLFYPASDIPPQARELYRESRTRVLFDAQSATVPLISQTGTDSEPVDMSLALLRAMSPVHREYLGNMGVRATLVTSIMHGNALWGLIAAHHRTPKRPGWEKIRAAESASRLISTAIELENAGRRTRGIAFAQSLLVSLPQLLAGQRSLAEGLVHPQTRLMELFQADGLAIAHRGQFLVRGVTPNDMGPLVTWLEQRGGRMFATDCLGDFNHAWADCPTPGLLALSIPNSLQGWVLWFRAEQTRNITWAGDPSKSVRAPESENTPPRLSPRKSFAAWTEIVRGRAIPWSDFERETAADVIRPNLLEVISGISERQAETIRRYQSILFDQVHDCIIVTDLDGIVTFWNDGATRTLGWTAAEMVGTHILERIKASDRAAAAKILADVHDGHPFAGRFRDTHKSGRTVWLDVRLRRIHDEHGRPIGIMGASRDVTSEHETEVQLRLQREILKHASDNIIVTEAEPIDAPGPRIIYVNDSCLRSTGYTREELIGQSPRIFQGPRTDRSACDRIRTAMKTWQPIREELINYRKDGSEYWIELYLTPLADETGWFTHWIGIQRDVTHRVRAEADLRERERAFRSLAENSPEPVFVLDPDDTEVPLRILYASQAVRQTHGYRPDEMIGRSILSFDSAEDRMKATGRREKILAGETLRFDVRHIARDGSLIPMEVCATVIDWGGRRAILALNRDIRERLHNEELLRRKQTYLRNVIDAIPVLLCARDKDGRITLVNRACAEAFQLDPDALIGHRDDDLATAPRPVDPQRSHLTLPPDGNTYEIEISLATGERRWISFAKTMLPDSDRRQSLCVAMDITGRRQLDEQNRQTQKLEAIGQLAGGVAHDFNNLLTIIRGNIDLILDGSVSPDQLPVYLEPVRRAADRGAGLTRQLLAFGRQQMVRVEPLHINDSIRDTIKMLERLLGEDIFVETDYNKSSPVIMADAGQFEQVLINLAVNARDAMPTGGCLTVSTGLKTVTSQDRPTPDAEPGDYAVLIVGDTGVGIPPEIRPRLFEPFFTTKSSGKGTGLGLATVYGIVRQLNGFITLESEVDVGTQWTIYFPIHHLSERNEPQIEPSSVKSTVHHSPTQSAKILVVEDDEAIRTLATIILERSGYFVMAAESGEHALRICDDWVPDVVMTDVVMPGMNGRELTEKLQARWPELRIIYLSGYTADTVIRYGVEHEHVSYLQKPYTPSALTGLLAEVLASKSETRGATTEFEIQNDGTTALANDCRHEMAK